MLRQIKTLPETKVDEAVPVHLPKGIRALAAQYLDADLQLNWPGDEKTKKLTPQERQQFQIFGQSYDDLQAAQQNIIRDLKEKEKKEIFPIFLDWGIEKIVNGYWDADIDLNWPGDEKTEKFSVKQRYSTMLFRQSYEKITSLKIAALILRGDTQGAIDLIEENRFILFYPVTTSDLEGRTIKGTVFQIMAMAGDRKLLEYFVPKLTPESAAQQLQVVTSEDAKQQNTQRNQAVFTAMIQFRKGILENLDEETLMEQLDKDLKRATNQTINCGYIFDPQIIIATAQMCREHIVGFGDINSQYNEILNKGFSRLIRLLSPDDKAFFSYESEKFNLLMTVHFAELYFQEKAEKLQNLYDNCTKSQAPSRML